MRTTVSNIPVFTSTEDAERYGRELRRVIAPDEFQTLVRVWLVTELGARDAFDPQVKVFLATRSGLLREAGAGIFVSRRDGAEKPPWGQRPFTGLLIINSQNAS